MPFCMWLTKVVSARITNKLGSWRRIYKRAYRWVKQGILDREFSRPQENDIINIQVVHVSLNSTAVKPPPQMAPAH